jgi:hypothetical protein
MDVTTVFSKIYQAEELNNTKTQVLTCFLTTKFDKSATNLTEALIWLGIGQVHTEKISLCVKILY